MLLFFIPTACCLLRILLMNHPFYLIHLKLILHSTKIAAFRWSPRMDVAESGRNYVITVEIPGVNIDDIRVEIDDQK